MATDDWIGELKRGAARVARGVGLVVAMVLLWLVALPLIVAYDLTARLPAAQTLLDGRERGSITVLDKDGAVLGVRGEQYRPLTVDDAAPVLVDAVLSIEDRRYYWHPGFDPLGWVRALLANYRAGRTVQGGSSIPQQVAKLAFLSPDRTVERKLREAPLAVALDWRFSKDDLLAIYLNRVYLGAGAYGFESAAQRYFGATARRLTTAQAALLAGLLRAPSRWSPESNFEGSIARAEVVLNAMLDAGRITALEQDRARAELQAMALLDTSELAPHFVDWIVEDVQARLDRLALEADGATRPLGDLVVRTTLDGQAQAAANQVVRAAFEASGDRLAEAEAAVAILSLDGAIRVMIGGRDYRRSQFNRAAAAWRQLGSAFKPVVYAAALEAGVRPNDYVDDRPITVGAWRPKNYGGNYRGWIPLEIALAESSNMAAVRLLLTAGPERVAEMAARAGFRQSVEPYPAIALGTIGTNPVEVASVYSVFARGGVSAPTQAIVSVREANGAPVWEPEALPPSRVISSQHAGWLTAMMREVVWSGTGRRAGLGEATPVAGKTGTTQSHRDAWFAGFTGHYVGAVWIGRDDNAPMEKLVGGETPAEIWREVMARLHDGLTIIAVPERPIPPPAPRPRVEQTTSNPQTRRAQAPASGSNTRWDLSEPAGINRDNER